MKRIIGYSHRRDGGRWVLRQTGKPLELISDPGKIIELLDSCDVVDQESIQEYWRALGKMQSSRSKDYPASIPAPEGLEYKPFQKAAIRYALEQRETLLSLEMGCGKTIVALGVANYTKARSILVVCPASLRINWAREARKWLLDSDIRLVISSYASLWKEDLKKLFDLAIFDESQYLKNPDAKRTELCLEQVMAKRKLYLSGTPLLNRPIEVHSIVHSIDPKYWGSRREFGKRYCDPTTIRIKTKWGYKNETLYLGSDNEEELGRRLRSKVMYRVTKEEVLKDLPPKVHRVITLGERRNKLLEKFFPKRDRPFADQVFELEEKDKAAFNEISLMRYETAMYKVPSVIQYVKDALENSGKVVLFAYHLDVIDKILTEFGDRAVSLVGGMTDRRKQSAVDKFQSPDSGVALFVGQIRAAGVGITLTASSHVVFAECDWTPGVMDQCVDRTHRIGQKAKSLTVDYLVLDGTIDARIAKGIATKQKNIEKILK